MTKIHSPADLSFLSTVKIGARLAKKCLRVSGNSKIQMRMLSHSEGLGILILTKDSFWPYVDVCEGNRSLSIFLVISYLLIIHPVPMSFCYHFGRLIRTWLQNV